MSPTVLQSGPYRFFFYSSDRGEPAHVHVTRERKEAKFWLEPVSVAEAHGFRSHELNRLRAMVIENRERFREAWNGYFGR